MTAQELKFLNQLTGQTDRLICKHSDNQLINCLFFQAKCQILSDSSLSDVKIDRFSLSYVIVRLDNIYKLYCYHDMRPYIM